jgi:hypothetical protein
LRELRATDRTVYALYDPVLYDEREETEEFTDMIKHWTDIMIKLYPTGPYFFAGFSSGCTFSYELAQQLTERKGPDAVAYVGMLDGQPAHDLGFSRTVGYFCGYVGGECCCCCCGVPCCRECCCSIRPASSRDTLNTKKRGSAKIQKIVDKDMAGKGSNASEIWHFMVQWHPIHRLYPHRTYHAPPPPFQRP